MSSIPPRVNILERRLSNVGISPHRVIAVECGDIPTFPQKRLKALENAAKSSFGDKSNTHNKIRALLDEAMKKDQA